MPIETQPEITESEKLVSEEAADWIREFSKHLGIEFVDEICRRPVTDNRFRISTVRATIATLIDAGIDLETIESELRKMRTAGKGLDQVSLFSEYVRLSKDRFFIGKQLNGDFASDPDQLLADWYASDEFSALVQTHAAMAKNVTVTGTGQ